MSERVRPYAWRRLDVAAGIAAGWLELLTEGPRVRGHELVADGPDCWACRFEIDLDPSWRSLRAVVTVEEGLGTRQVELTATEPGVWTQDGESREDLSGCLDVDIADTVVTNTLPLRRLDLAVGESAEVRVVWVDVPRLTVRPTSQRYKRLPPAEGYDRYEYNSLAGRRPFVLSVDEEGMVVDYEGFARRIRATR